LRIKKPYKIIVIGLPKTGTSTITVMLRMLGYEVSGPEINFIKNDDDELFLRYEQANAFQDYPWCFEWKQFCNMKNVKFIILYRDRYKWWESFYNSYGKQGVNYLSYPYFNMPKNKENKSAFLEFYDTYYKEARKHQRENPKNFYYTETLNLSWIELCEFLNEKIPRNLIGRISKIPHANKYNYKRKRSIVYSIINYGKNSFIRLFGLSNYRKITSFFHKNRI